MIILFLLNVMLVPIGGLLLLPTWKLRHWGRCQHKGCKNEGFYCSVDYGAPTGPEYEAFYCADHAGRNGFCKICGSFWGGIESFEFVHPDICDNCWDDIHEDFDRCYRDDDYPDPSEILDAFSPGNPWTSEDEYNEYYPFDYDAGEVDIDNDGRSLEDIGF